MQTLSLQPQEAHPFTVLKATGELDLATQDEFERVVAQLLQSTPVIVDLSELEFFAISALRSLIVLHQMAISTGQAVFYAEPSGQLSKLLKLSGLREVLPVGSPLDESTTVG